MRQPIMVGCDLHDQTMLLKIARGAEAARTVTVKNTAAGRRRMIEQLREQAAGNPLLFVYEASGQGFGLHNELTEAGMQCYVLAPTRIARSTQGKRRKTDEQDADQLLQLLRAHLLAGNDLPTVWIPDLQTRDDRELARARLDAAEKLTGLKTQVQGLLKRHRLARPTAVGRGWTRSFRAWLRCLGCDESCGSGLRAALASLLRQLEFIEAEIERLDQAVAGLAAAPRHAAAVQQLAQLRGVGVLTALVFLTEVGDLGRFENRRQISAYLWLVPSSQESGQRNDRKGHIPRQGPSRVRRVLCQAVWARVRYEGPAQEAYQRIVDKNPKHKKIAVVALMRRLAVLMWHRGREATPPAPPARRSADDRVGGWGMSPLPQTSSPLLCVPGASEVAGPEPGRRPA